MIKLADLSKLRKTRVPSKRKIKERSKYNERVSSVSRTVRR